MVPTLAVVFWWLFYHTFGAGGLVLALALSLPQLLAFFATVRYTVSDRGIEIRSVFGRRFRTWSHYRGFYPFRDAVQLLHAGKDLRARLLPGTIVYTEPSTRPELIGLLRERFPRAGGGDGGGRRDAEAASEEREQARVVRLDLDRQVREISTNGKPRSRRSRDAGSRGKPLRSASSR